MSRYIFRKFPTYRLPPEALLDVKNLSFLEAARWAHCEPCSNLIDPSSKIAELSRSLAPLHARERDPVWLQEGDELLVITPHPRGIEPKSLGDFRFTWVRLREISHASNQPDA